jgi:hypothetical protein
MTVIVSSSGCALGLPVFGIMTLSSMQAVREAKKLKIVNTTKHLFIKASLLSGFIYYTEIRENKTTPHFSRAPESFIDNQYFTKREGIPENRGAGVRPLPYFRASSSHFVIY